MAERTFQLRAALDALSDAMLAADRSNHVVAVNAGLTRLLGWTPDRIEGHSLRSVLPITFDEVEDHARDMLGTAIPLPAQRADGTEVDVEVVLSRVEADDGPLIVATLRDVSARITLERWSDTDRSLLAQYEVMTMLARGGELAGVAGEILRSLCLTLDWDAGLYWEPDDVRGRLQLRQTWEQDAALVPVLEVLEGRALQKGEGVAGEAWATRWLSTWRAGSDVRPPPLDVDMEAGVRSAVAIPVVWGRRVHAVLSFLTTRHMPTGDKPLQTLSMMGLQIGQFMERLGVEAEAKARAQWLSTTLRSIGDAVIATDLRGRLAFMNPVAEALTGWSGKAAEGQRLEQVFRILHPTTRAALEMPTTDVLEGGESKAPSKHVLLVARDGTERLIEHGASPIRAEAGEPQGAVVVFRDTTEKVQTEAELARLLTAEQLARAAADFQRELAAFLDEANSTLGRSLDAQTTFAELAGISVPRLADWCAIHVTDAEGRPKSQLLRSREPASCAGLSSALEKGRVAHLAFGIPGVLEEAKGGIVLSEAPHDLITERVTDPTVRETLLGLGLTSLLSVPLRSRGELLGWMTLATTSGYRRFGTRDVELFQELSQRAGQALDNVRLYREAQEAVRVRDDFLSIASHELRTPLTPLQLQLQALMRAIRTRQPPPSPEQVGQKLEVIARQVVRLERLVTSLLDISRITGKRLVLELEELDITEVVAELVHRSEEHAQQQGSPLHFSAPGVTMGHWDRLRIEQIVTNLLSNAIKFGAGKPISVELTADADTVWLRVVDRGIGIPPMDHARIFERFERAVAVRHFGGFGLGLWIVRQLVEAMGGAVQVESVSGQGSTFEVRLPRRPPGKGAVTPEADGVHAG